MGRPIVFYAAQLVRRLGIAGALVAGRLGVPCPGRVGCLERRRLTGAAAGASGLQVPAWLSPWVPPEVVQAITSLISGLALAVDGLLQAVPALAGGLSVATWVIWGIGSVLQGVIATFSTPSRWCENRS
jgi:hypothetical protein